MGYEVEVPMSTFLALPPLGSAVRLRIHHVLREDASQLFGFATEAERELFRALLKVNGVGPKVALAVLSGVSADAFRAAIATEDVATLTRIPGVGRKTAERLLVEMRDHFKEIPARGGASGSMSRGPRHCVRCWRSATSRRRRSACWRRCCVDGASTEDLIRAALQGTTLKQERS